MTYNTEEPKTMETYQADFSWTENKKSLLTCFTPSVSSTRSFDWNLESLISRQIVKIYLVRGSAHFTVTLGIYKTMPLATMSQHAHACWELKYWSPSTLLVCGHFIQIHSCMSICFSCMYTHNYKHFHKWFGIFYSDNLVLMRVPHNQ